MIELLAPMGSDSTHELYREEAEANGMGSRKKAITGNMARTIWSTIAPLRPAGCFHQRVP